MSAFAAKNVFVNPFYQEGVGRRTGIVLNNKDVRKDSDGFEVFDDYWSESENDATVNTTYAVEKENIDGSKPTPRREKSSLKSMPSFSPQVASSDREQSKVELPQEISQAAENASALEADLTGSILKAPVCSREPLSALRQFKTRQRLSFSGQELTSSEESQTTEEEGSVGDEGESQDSGGESSEGTIKAPSSSQDESSQDEGGDGRAETEVNDAGAESGTTEEEEDSERLSSQETSEPLSQEEKEPEPEGHLPDHQGDPAAEEVSSSQQSAEVGRNKVESPSSSQESTVQTREIKRRSTRGRSAHAESTSVEDKQDTTVSKGKGSRKSVSQSKNIAEKEDTVEKEVLTDAPKGVESRRRKSTRQSLKVNKEDDTTKNETGRGNRKSTHQSNVSVRNDNSFEKDSEKEATKEPDTRRRKSTRRSKVNAGKDNADNDKEDNLTQGRSTLPSNMSMNKENGDEKQVLKEAKDAEATRRRKSTRRSNRAENKEEKDLEKETDNVKTRRSRGSRQSNRVEHVQEDKTEGDRSTQSKRKGRSLVTAEKELEVEKEDKVAGEYDESKEETEEDSAGEKDVESQGEEFPNTVTNDKVEETETGEEESVGETGTEIEREKDEESETGTDGEKLTEPEKEEEKSSEAEPKEALEMETEKLEKTEEQVETDEVILSSRTNVIEDYDDDDDTDRIFFSIRANKTAPSVSALEEDFDVADADPQEFGIVDNSVKENHTVAESPTEQSITKADNKRRKKKNKKENAKHDDPENLKSYTKNQTQESKWENEKGKGKNKKAVKRGSDTCKEDDQKKLKESPEKRDEGIDDFKLARGSKKSRGKKSKKVNDIYSKDKRGQRTSSSSSQATSSNEDADSQLEDHPTKAVCSQQKNQRKQEQKRNTHLPGEIEIDEDRYSKDEVSCRVDVARSHRGRRSSVHFTTKDMISVSGDISVHQVVSSEEDVVHHKKAPPTPAVLSKDKKKTRRSSKVRSGADVDRNQNMATDDDATNIQKRCGQSGSESTAESEREAANEGRKGKKKGSKSKQRSKLKSSHTTLQTTSVEEHLNGQSFSEGTAESENEMVNQGRKGKQKGTKTKQSSKRNSSNMNSAISMEEHQSDQSHHDSTAESEEEITDQRERRKGKKKGTKTKQSSKRRSSHSTLTTCMAEVEDSGVKKRRREQEGAESSSGSQSDASYRNAGDRTGNSSPDDHSARGNTPLSSILKGGKDQGTRRQDKKKYSILYTEKALPKAYIIKPDEEDGVRRTRRQRVRPLEYWRNERPLYERRKSGGFALAGILSPEQTEERVSGKSVRQAAKPRGMLPVTPTHIPIHATPPIGTSSLCKPTINVVNPDTEQEVAIDAVATSKMLKFTGPSGLPAKPDDPITISKALSQKAFSAGVLTVRPFEEKGSQLVRRDTMVFNVVRGKVAMTLHKTSQILQNGDWFFVPKGNVYNIKNLRKDEAKLSFFQLKSS